MDINTYGNSEEPSSRKEFIDHHSLLTADYIRDPTFIMDLIENQIVFSKSQTNIGGLHYFPITNKSAGGEAESSSLSEIAPPLQNGIDTSSALNYKNTSNLITLGEEYVSSEKAFNVEQVSSAHSYTALPMLTDTVIIEESEVSEDVGSTRFARKALPHKKRISRKLKSIPEERLQFKCEICGHCAISQLGFFAHLKQHYEPTNPDATIHGRIENIELNKSCSDMCAIPKKTTTNDVEQVFKSVNIHFSDFENGVSEPNGISPSVIEKCIDFENTADTLKNIVNEEIEFSDTEDMLEGIRNVVDKVSIEDSCDDIDLMASSGLRGHWFSGNSYQEMTPESLKDNVPLPGTSQILNSDQISGECMEACTIKVEPTLRFPDNRKLIDFSSYCSEKLRNDVSIESSSLEQNKKDVNTSFSEDTVSSLNDLDISYDLSPVSIKKEKRTEKHFYCPDCKRDFNSGNALKYHMQIHTGIRPHQCDICAKSFFARGALQSHIRTHTGEKPFQCDVCQQRFRQWSDLKYHKTSIHSEIKSHQCEFCGKSFSRKYSLVLHIRIHENIRNYKCEFCDKAFRASTYLQNHRRIHTGEKPHGCKTCGKHFRVYGDLRRHLRIHQRCKATDAGETENSSSTNSKENT